jgi:CheY-like chemotaxis protein
MKNVTRSILVVEDEKISSMLLEHLLSELNYRVVGTASTGEEAIRQAACSRPDLIIMDVGLKGAMNGIEAAQIIHQQQQIPILFLTAYMLEEISDRHDLPDRFGFLPKPVMLEELELKLKELLGQVE